MKKTYAKPEISFEDFAFSSNVAGDCGGVNGIQTAGSCDAYGTMSDPITGNCLFVDGDFKIFAQGTECDFQPDDADMGNLCYHVSSAANKIFKS